MEKRSSLPVKNVLPLALLLGIPGWLAIIYLVTRTVPDLGNRWLFFAAVVVAMSGTALPAVAFLNRIIQPFGPAGFETILRESLMVGVYVGILLWLNNGQVLSLGLAAILGVGLLLVDLLLRFQQRSSWSPESTD